MVEILINGKDNVDIQCMKYWSFPSSYSREKRREELSNMLYSDAYVASEKKDGHFYFFYKDDNGAVFLRSRTKGVNGWNFKNEFVPHMQDFFDKVPNSSLLVGEMYLPGETSKAVVSILGCLLEKSLYRQQDDKKKMHFYIFDVLYWGGQELHLKGAEERSHFLTDTVAPLAEEHLFIDFPTFWYTGEDIHENWLRILDEGGEGVVMSQKNYSYNFGKRTARKNIKLKKELEETIDVFLTGRYKEATYLYTGKELDKWSYWYNPQTGERINANMSERLNHDGFEPVTSHWYHGFAGSVEIGMMKDGKEIVVGYISNITQDVREGIVKDNSKYKHRVLELQAMEIDRSNAIPTLRHAKIEQWRDDKDYKDCSWEQLL